MFISTPSNNYSLLHSNRGGIKDAIIEKSGIMDRRRIIHIFYDQTSPETCKVIQINVSVTKGSGVLFDQFFMNRYNGTLSFVSVYVYDCQLNSVGRDIKDQFRYGKLTLLTAKRLDRETDFDNDVTTGEHPQLFSSFYKNYNLSNYVDSRVLVHPYYYTQEHEYHTTGDFNPAGLYDDLYNSFTIIGNDIIDDVTVIYQQPPNNFKTIKDTLLISDPRILFGESKIETAASDTIGEINYMLGCDTMVNGGVIIYDTQMGIRFDNSSILNKPYMASRQADEELSTFVEAVKMQATNIEQNHGSIRLMYIPSLIGSKCRIIFKDSNNKISDHGLSDASKDSSFEVTETIGKNVDDGGAFVNKHLVEGIDYPFMEREQIKSYFD